MSNATTFASPPLSGVKPIFRVVSTSEALGWAKQAWAIYKLNPFAWSGFFAVFIMAALFVGKIPYLGFLFQMFINPLFSIGTIYCGERVLRSEPLQFENFFYGFRIEILRKIVMVVLLQTALCFLLLLAGIVFLIIFLMALGMSAMLTTFSPDNWFQQPLLIVGVSFLVVLFVAPAMMTLYSVPLVAFRGANTLDALEQSFKALLKNMWPVTWVGLYMAFLFIVVAIFTLSLGLVVLIPISSIVYFLSFRAIFPAPADEATPVL